ncbi:CDP-diacylglycerol diphosphatase [Mixta sp. Marseille-Q2057]|nr:CDP-diacylglycerol diphosphatase [Mixta mediterraneensis]
MQGRRCAFNPVVVLLALIITAMLVAAFHFRKNSDALWQIVSEKCVPNLQREGQPMPCQKVDLARGYATLKDLKGPLQYLLIPVVKTTGIESPQLLDPATANYIALAWQERHLLAQRRAKPIKDRMLSLAINAQYGRTQNQLHIHISCLRPDVRQRLDVLAASLNDQWQTETLRKHRYLLRTLTTPELLQQSAFIRLATEVPNARNAMGKYGLAVASLSDGRLVLMAIERNWLLFNSGSAEELQDHSCKLLRPINEAAQAPPFNPQVKTYAFFAAAAALTITVKASAFSDAPPTNAPSISG